MSNFRLRTGALLSTFALALTTLTAITAQAEEAAPAPSTSPNRVKEETDRLVVHFKNENKGEQKNAIESAEKEAPEVKDLEVVKESVAEDQSMVVVETDQMLDKNEQKAAMKALEEDPRVDSVEPDPVVHALGGLPTQEPLYTLQWALKSPYLNAPSAWQTGYTGDGQTVGIVDTGYSKHPDLRAPVAQYDFISDTYYSLDGNGRDASALDTSSHHDGANWHGTFVDGQIAAKSNSYGIAGLAHGANVTHARALGYYGDGYGTDIADAITWASGGTVAGAPRNPKPATVINASLAYPSSPYNNYKCSGFMAEAINSALSREVPVVVAAGNSGQNASAYEPANCWRAIVVGATEQNNVLATYSNYGSTLDVVAPGGSASDPIYSTTNTGFDRVGASSFGNKYGTSMATPHVTATIALMKEANPSLTVEQIRQTLTRTGRDIGGYKMINPRAAIKAVTPAGAYSTVSNSAIEKAYLAGGSSSVFGLPSSNQFSLRDGGAVQRFAKNYAIYTSPFTPAAPVNFSGAIGSFYAQAGYENAYGYPVVGEQRLTGGAMQRFRAKSGQETALIWSSSTGVHTLNAKGALYNYWRTTGLSQGLGYPVTNETKNPDGSAFVTLSSGVTLRWTATGGVQKISFTDIAGHPFKNEILWLAGTGITTGWPDRTFRPDTTTQRGAMAAFFYRMAGSPTYTPPTKPTFKDVPRTHQFYKEIEWMEDRGITTGWPDGTFRPYATTQRDAMAAFFYRYAKKPAFTPSRVSPFTDLGTRDMFYREISWFSQQGITTGWPDGTYRPTEPVQRGAMAAFIYRYMDR